MPAFRKTSFIASAVGLVCLIAGLATGNPTLWQPSLLVALVALAAGISATPPIKGYSFTVWILVAVAAGMIYPGAFKRWGPVELRHPWLVLAVVQLVMFGMGTQMKLKDFAGVLKMPWGVFVAVGCQFLVMPLVGWGLIHLAKLPPEVAAGVILIGCCSSGLSSNVMTYLAGGNLPLSITATAVTTMLAPLMTPLWMKLLAGTLVEVSFVAMMVTIIKIVLVPIVAALIHDALATFSPKARKRLMIGCGIATGWLVLVWFGRHWFAEDSVARTIWVLSGFVAAAGTAGLIYDWLIGQWSSIQRAMPVFSMAGIVYFTTVTTAAGRDNLLEVGLILIVVAIAHNGAGYVFGYWFSRLAGLDRRSCRTVAFEVGLQNGGMASGLAGSMGKLATLGLAAAIFSPWMNISGSILANYWKRLHGSNDDD